MLVDSSLGACMHNKGKYMNGSSLDPDVYGAVDDHVGATHKQRKNASLRRAILRLNTTMMMMMMMMMMIMIMMMMVILPRQARDKHRKR
jgi:hypothetical protein